MLQCTFEIPGTIRSPNTITSVVRTRRRAGHIADPETDLRSAVCVDGILIDVLIGVSQPKSGFGHGPFALSRGTGVETIVERDGVREERVQIESDGGLGEGIDTSGIPEGAVLSGDELEENGEEG